MASKMFDPRIRRQRFSTEGNLGENTLSKML
jgi:hypothetical protein